MSVATMDYSGGLGGRSGQGALDAAFAAEAEVARPDHEPPASDMVWDELAGVWRVQDVPK